MRYVILTSVLAIMLAQPFAEMMSGYPVEQLRELEKVRHAYDQRQIEHLLNKQLEALPDVDDASKLAKRN